MMKKMLAIVMALMMACLTGAALASAGDRTLLTTSAGSGYMSEYVENAILCGGKAYLYTWAITPGFYVVDLATGESVRYSLEQEEERMRGAGEDAEGMKTEDGDSYTESIAGWFGYEGEIYAIVTRNISRDEETGIDGGYVRKAAFADGQVTLGECGFPRLDWSGMIERDGGFTYGRYIYRQAVTGDWLAAAVNGDSGTELRLFNLKTGEAEAPEIDNLNDIAAGPDGKLLIGRVIYDEEQQVFVDLYDIAEDESENLVRTTSGDGYYNSFAWNTETDTLYFIRNGEIFAAPGRDLENAEAVNECSISASGMFAQVTEDGFLFVYGYDGALLRNTDPAARGDVTIRIRPFAWTGGMEATYYAFTEAHGDIGVVREDYGDETALLQGMMNRDDRVDLYTITANSSAFSAVYDRGFLADLSGSEKLMAETDRMYPFLRELVTKDGKLVAFPVQMSGDAFGYNTEAWAKLGWTEAELPRTWDGLLDLLESLPEKLEGTDFRPFELWTSQESLRSMLLTRMVQQYALSRPDDSFNTPLLQRLLDRVMKLDFDALGMATDEEMENIWEEYAARGGEKTRLLTTSMEVGISSWESEMQVLALRFEEGEEPVIPVQIAVVFLNPYSQHPEEATAYIECMADNLGETTVSSFDPDKNDPLRYPNHEEQRKNLSDMIATVRKYMDEAADEDDRETWEKYLGEMEKELEEFDETNWWISPKAIENYRARAAWLKPETESYWTLLWGGENGEAFRNLWNGYIAGQKNAQELLSFMDQKIRMMRMEGN